MTKTDTYTIVLDRKSTQESMMDTIKFIIVMITGALLIFFQCILAYIDEFFSSKQMEETDIMQGYSLLQHGGVWYNAIILTPLIAYLVGKYQFDYYSTVSVVIATGSMVFWILSTIFVYNPMGKITPEAHTHDGRTTEAGWSHVVYASLATWILAMVYITDLTTPEISTTDVLITSGILIPWIFFGVVKFNREWVFSPFAKKQVAIEIIAICVLTAIRLYK